MSIEAVRLESTSGQNAASAFVRWYVLIMMVLVYTLSIADRYVVSTVLEPIRVELHLSDSRKSRQNIFDLQNRVVA